LKLPITVLTVIQVPEKITLTLGWPYYYSGKIMLLV